MHTKIILGLLSILSLSLFIGCSSPIPEPIKVTITSKKISYLDDVKPILDKRCVSCHSCYNSPCQSKLSSFEGVDRGASKKAVYDAIRLNAMEPTRLFIDAKNTNEWRDKEFFSVTQNLDANTSYNDSIMMHMLEDKKKNPEVIGSYRPEYDELVCPKDTQEMGDYIDDKPNHGMPYGFPAIKDSEHKTLSQWLFQGAKGPSAKEQEKISSPSKEAALEIKKWEDFLNTQDAKHSVTARYLYEHLYLAHWSFKSAPTEFYEIIRSKTPAPQEIDSIATVRVFDDPKVDKFYYRLQRIHSTIVHKTHMVVKFDDEKLQRIKELFITPRWDKEPYYLDYSVKKSANPFISFEQIPAKSRYQFLLNNSHFMMMTFIRGPVCRGQMAVNVIHDHFWVMFKNPEYDLSVQNPEFLKSQFKNLSMPIESSEQSLLKIFSDKYRDKDKQYINAKVKAYEELHPNGHNLESIWRGDRAEDSPILTIYRHFDNASIHHGAIGELPRTLWVVDFPILEKIYYSLVAGYDVFGNLSHQSNVRRYTDFLRFEAELDFLAYMPVEDRMRLLKSWYIDTDIVQEGIKLFNKNSQIDFNTIYPKNEFIEKVINEHILKSTNIHFDDINYFKSDSRAPKMPKEFTNIEDIKNGFRALTAPGTEFIKYVTDDDVNNMLIRIKISKNKDFVGSMVVNRWHDNVNSQFSEEDTLNSELDTLDFIPYSIGSYPNALIVIEYEELPEFFDLVQNYEDTDTYNLKIEKFLTRRGDKDFWEVFDWFQDDFTQKKPIKSGLYDLNRYYHK